MKIKVGIVDDDPLFSLLIKQSLYSIGYDVLDACTDYNQAIAMLDNEQPDIVLLDIELGHKSGIEIADYLRKNLDIPFIFISGNSDEHTLNKAKSVKPNAYLVKPCKPSDLYVAIEIAINNFNHSNGAKPNEESPSRKDIIFIKERDYFHKVNFDDILFLSSESVYVTIHTNQKKFLVRASLNEYLKKFDPSKFIRVHQRYAVNINKVDKINHIDLLINKQEIPISKGYKKTLIAHLNLD